MLGQAQPNVFHVQCGNGMEGTVNALIKRTFSLGMDTVTSLDVISIVRGKENHEKNSRRTIGGAQSCHGYHELWSNRLSR